MDRRANHYPEIYRPLGRKNKIMNVPISAVALTVISADKARRRAFKAALAAKDAYDVASNAYNVGFLREVSISNFSPEFEVIRREMSIAHKKWELSFSVYEAAAEAHDLAVRNEREALRLKN